MWFHPASIRLPFNFQNFLLTSVTATLHCFIFHGNVFSVYIYVHRRFYPFLWHLPAARYFCRSFLQFRRFLTTLFYRVSLHTSGAPAELTASAVVRPTAVSDGQASEWCCIIRLLRLTRAKSSNEKTKVLRNPGYLCPPPPFLERKNEGGVGGRTEAQISGWTDQSRDYITSAHARGRNSVLSCALCGDVTRT